MAETPTETRPINSAEYRDKTPEEISTLRDCEDAEQVSVDFCQPYFEKFIRMNNLYRGILPSELDNTFSKVMLNLAMSICQNELPRKASMLFSQEDFFALEAEDKTLEYGAESATRWLNYQIRKRNGIWPNIHPTLLRVNVFGTGYRVVSQTMLHKEYVRRTPRGTFGGIPYGFHDEKYVEDRLGITSQNVDIFAIMPSPGAGLVNGLDNQAEACADWVIWTDYMSETKLKSMMLKPGWNRRAVMRMLGQKTDMRGQPNTLDMDYRERAAAGIVDGTSNGIPGWIESTRQRNNNLSRRYRVKWFFFRDKWVLIGEGRSVLYSGAPLLDWIPIAKYVDTPSFEEWYGTGLIETCEDVILAYLLNFGFRMDYLATTLHPTKFIREDVVKQNGANINDFDPTPFGMFTFPKKIDDIRKAVWYDRFPEISPQAFIEETNFKQLLQEITAQPNYMKGMGGAGTLANETATGIVSLIEEGTARSTMRSLFTEYIGLHDELKLFLKFGKAFVWEDQEVRRSDIGGTNWTSIPADEIDDGYGIELRGTRELIHKNEMLKRMLSVMPLFMNNPNVPNQRAMMEEANKKLQVFTDKIFQAPINQPALMDAGMMGQSGEATMGPGTPTMQNDMQATQGRTGQVTEMMGVGR